MMNLPARCPSLGISLGIVILAASAGSAFAEGASEPDYSASGIYASIGANLGIEAFKDDMGLDHEDAGGFNLRLGYRAHPRFAVELGYEWLRGFEVEPDPVGSDLTWWMTYLNAKAFLATGRIQPFLLLGLGAAKMSDELGGNVVPDESVDFAGRFGAGFDLYVSENVAISIDGAYILPVSNLEDFTFFSIGFGIQYRF